MDKRIKCLVLANGTFQDATKDKPIESIYKNGEMALVGWFRWGNVETNGRYVEQIIYED